MKSYRFDDIDALCERVSAEFGPWSQELEITQELIDRFAELSGDDYWLHTDPDRCKSQSPFGCTIAHGFLTLVLLSRMTSVSEFEIIGFNNMLNYGSDKLRFTGAVPVGSRIHSRSRISAVDSTPKGTRITRELNVHVVGQQRPALVYELRVVYM